MGKAFRWKAADFDRLLSDEEEIRRGLGAHPNDQQTLEIRGSG